MLIAGSLAALFVLYTLYYFKFAVKPTQLYHSKDSVHHGFGIPRSLKYYYPSFFLINNHIQTAGSKFLRVRPNIMFRRELVSTPDGGEVAIDWDTYWDTHGNSDTPVVIVMHGLVGSSTSKYVRHTVMAMRNRGWRAVAINARGCGTSVLKNPFTFNAGTTDDFRAIVNNVTAKYPNAPLFAVAFSLGANMLTKYLGEVGENSPFKAAVCVSNPFDLWLVNTDEKSNQSKIFRFYLRMLARDLKLYLLRHKEVFADVDLDFEHIMRARNIHEYDERATLKLLPYKTVEEYYSQASCIEQVKHIRIPVIFINSEDDPLIPKHLVPHESSHDNPNILFAMTKRGGHIAYLKNLKFWSVSWSDEVAGEFFGTIVDRLVENKETPRVMKRKSKTDLFDITEPLLAN